MARTPNSVLLVSPFFPGTNLVGPGSRGREKLDLPRGGLTASEEWTPWILSAAPLFVCRTGSWTH